MASVRGIQAAAAYVELSMRKDKFNKELNSVQKRFRRAMVNMGRIGAGMFGVGAAILTPFAFMTRDAADAIESTDRFEQVFRNNLDEAGRFAEGFAKRFNRALTEVQDTMSGIGSKFLQLPNPEDAIKFTEAMTQFAYDFGSFSNLSDMEALRRTVGALSGEAENLDRFGINIRDQNLNATFRELEAMGLGFQDVTTRTATENQKIIARSYSILQQAEKLGITGDLARTFDKPAAVMRQFTSMLKELRQEMGKAFIESFKDLAKVGIGTIKIIKRLVKTYPDIVRVFVKLTAAVTILGASLITLSTLALIATRLNYLGIFLTGMTQVLSLLVTTLSVLTAFLLANPLALFATALAATAVAFLYLTGTFDALFQRMGEAAQMIVRAYDGAVQYLMSGNLEKAWDIVLQYMKVATMKFIQGFSESFGGFFEWLGSQVSGEGGGILGRMVDATLGMSARGAENKLNEMVEMAAEERKKFVEEMAKDMFRDPGGEGLGAKTKKSAANAMGTFSSQIAGLFGVTGPGKGNSWRTDRQKQKSQADLIAEANYKKNQEILAKLWSRPSPVPFVSLP